MADLYLRRNRSEPGLPLNIHLDGVVRSFDATFSVDVYWRFEDEPTARPEFLGSTKPGVPFKVPFDPKGRSIRLYSVSRSENADFSVQDINAARQFVFDPPADNFSGKDVLEAAEDLAAFDLVNIFNDGGTQKARLAVNTDPAKRADAFVVEAAAGGGSLTTGSDVVLFFGGNIITSSGLTPGAMMFLSDTPGKMTATPPTAAGSIVQQIGTAISPTEVIFEPGQTVELA